MYKFLILVLIPFQVMAQTVKIGLVDIQTIITSVSEGKEVMKRLEKTYNSKKDQLKKEEDKIKKLQESFQKQVAVLSEQARISKEKELQESMMKLQNKTMEYQKEIQKMEQDLKKPIIEKLRPIIDDVSKEAKVAMTFEVSASPIVYAENKVDLTSNVIKAYDKKHAAKKK